MEINKETNGGGEHNALLLIEQIVNSIKHLEQIRGSNVIVYVGQDKAPFPKPIEDEDISMLFHCLEQIGHVDTLDLVLHTYGGNVVYAQKMSLLLRAYSQCFNVLIPYKARSAGTLLCLGSNNIIMSVLAELSPLDPQIHTATSTGGPTTISSEDLHSFVQMAETWFHVNMEDQGMHLLKLLCEHFFPTSLASFFRAEALVKTLALELLRFHLPSVEEQQRESIVTKLVNGYHSHTCAINREESEKIGLNITKPTHEEDQCTQHILHSCERFLQVGSTDMQKQMIDGIIATKHLYAYHIVEWQPEVVPSAGPGGSNPTPSITTRSRRSSRWEIVSSEKH